MTALLQGQEYLPASGDEGTTPRAAVKAKHKPKKGDPRIIVKLSELETAVFGDRTDPEKVYGRRKNRKARFIRESGEWKSVDMEDAEPTATDPDADDTAGSLTDDGVEDTVGGVSINDHVRSAQTQSDVNFSVGGERGWAEKIEETPEMLAKRREGQKRAEEKELVKSAARRAVVFGLMVDAETEKPGKRGKKDRAAEPDQPSKVRRKCEALMSGKVAEPSFAKGDFAIRFREEGE